MMVVEALVIVVEVVVNNAIVVVVGRYDSSKLAITVTYNNDGEPTTMMVASTVVKR